MPLQPRANDAPYIIDGRRQPVQKRARLTVASILQAAEAVFVEEGYANASTNRIAERAGVAISSLYQYFPDKRSIYLSLYSQTLTMVADQLNQGILEVITDDLDSGMRQLVSKILTLFEENRLILLLLADEVPEIRQGDYYFNLSNLVYNAGRVFLHQKLDTANEDRKQQLFFFLHTITFASLRSYILSEEQIFDRQTFINELTRLIVGFLREGVGDQLG